MSDFGEEIINRLGVNSSLKIDSDMGRLIDYTIGEWLTRENDKEFLEQFFLQEATGKYLDLHGKTYGVLRRIDESDDSYRQRIIYESIGHLTVEFLREVYNLELYVNIPNFNVSNNTLTSDNPYYNQDGFMASADTSIKDILNKKFVLGASITWL